MHTHKFCVAPMIDWTDRHCRYFYRLLSSNARLYTQMISATAILHGDKKRLLDYDAIEHPLALQLAGSDAQDMAKCAKIAADWGYDEVNINVGCPSDRVQSGGFGACLMKTPKIVGDCVQAMRRNSDIKISVKSRIGVDDIDSFAHFSEFINIVHNSGCDTFIIHARKAWLKGLSPKQNRDVPELKYDWVYKIKQLFPELDIIINGGIADLNQAQQHLKKVDGVMLGRQVYHNPYILTTVDAQFYNQTPIILSRENVLLKFIEYMQQQHNKGVPIRAMTRHILGLYHGQQNAKKFKRLLSGAKVELDNLYKWLEFVN